MRAIIALGWRGVPEHLMRWQRPRPAPPPDAAGGLEIFNSVEGSGNDKVAILNKNSC